MRIASRVDGQFLKAVIDEVAIWDRVLSAGEVEQNMVGSLTTAVRPECKLATNWASIKNK